MRQKRDHCLFLRITEDEEERIRENAKAMDKTVSAYMREVGKYCCVLKNDYPAIDRHTNEITYLRNAINQLVYTIWKTGEYVPADLEYILKKMNEISKSENQFLNLMLFDKEEKTRAIRREVRRVVRAEITKKEKQKQKNA